MKKVFLYIITAPVLTAFILMLTNPNYALSQVSRYEGKIVKKLVFEGERNVDGKMQKVPIVNNKIIDLLNYCITEEGLPLKASNIRKDMKALFDLANLSDVKVDVSEIDDGVIVRFICSELPIVSDIEWKGNDSLRNVDLESKLMFKKNDSFDMENVNRSVQLLKEYCISEGLFNAVVNSKIDINNEKNSVKVTFIIDEGEDIEIEKISILGTNKIKDYELIALMDTKEDGVFEEGTFDQSVLDMDIQKIKYYYRKNGYMDAEVAELDIDYQWENPEEPNSRRIYITMKIDEGECYYYDGYEIEGNTEISTEDIENVLEQEKNYKLFNNFTGKTYRKIKSKQETEAMPFDGFLYEKDKSMIAFLYSSKGFIWTRVIPEQKITEKEVLIDGEIKKVKFIHVRFKIIESEKAYVENIVVKGNVKTRDYVIKRELLFKEGDLFNSRRLERTRERIYALGYFKEINIDVRPGSASDKANVIITVEEQATGAVSIGGGYGTVAGFSIFADISEKNLYGRGQSVGGKIEYGPNSGSIELSFFEPWLFKTKPISFRTSVNYSRSEQQIRQMFADSDSYAKYKTETIGYSIGTGYRMFIYYGVGLTWSHSLSRIIDAEGTCPDEIFESQENGFQERRTISLNLYHSSKNHPYVPTKGLYLGINTAITGGHILGGDDHYVQYTPKFEFYYSPFHLPMLQSHNVVFKLRARGDFLNPPWFRDDVRDYQDPEENAWLEPSRRLSMRVGYQAAIRGWGAMDPDFPTSWNDGMFHRVIYGTEFQLPIHPQFLWAAFFFDAGALFTDSYWEDFVENEDQLVIDKENEDLYNIKDIGDADLMEYFKYSYGFGLRIQIPVLPLRFWFAKKLIWNEDDKFEEISDWKFVFEIGDIVF